MDLVQYFCTFSNYALCINTSDLLKLFHIRVFFFNALSQIRLEVNKSKKSDEIQVTFNPFVSIEALASYCCSIWIFAGMTKV